MSEELLTPTEVGTIFKVNAKTVTRWSDAGKLTSVRTLGGHRRFIKAEVEALYNETRFVPKGNGSNVEVTDVRESE